MGFSPPFVGVAAVKTTGVPSQNTVSLAEIKIDGTTTGFTVMVIILLIAGTGEGQVSLEIISTLTWFPFKRELVVKTVLLIPTGVPPTYHWYTGLEPPFVGVAVNVKLVPAQILFDGDTEIETDGVIVEFTIIIFCTRSKT